MPVLSFEIAAGGPLSDAVLANLRAIAEQYGARLTMTEADTQPSRQPTKAETTHMANGGAVILSSTIRED